MKKTTPLLDPRPLEHKCCFSIDVFNICGADATHGRHKILSDGKSKDGKWICKRREHWYCDDHVNLLENGK
jgi:hypothetical protein